MFGLNKNKKDDSTKIKDVRSRSTAEDSGKRYDSAVLADGGLILRRPWVSERAMKLNEQGQYVFAVDSTATKPAVKQAVENLFRVRVERVNIVNIKPKAKVFRGRVGRQGGFKKAIVKLARGHKIEVLPR
ncbi:MAG: 50S ribosomal protein L23 [Parcubacteria group bacterium]|nr:50S ribosomal protein L23 [Parcubacteria group bacterium]